MESVIDTGDEELNAHRIELRQKRIQTLGAVGVKVRGLTSPAAFLRDGIDEETLHNVWRAVVRNPGSSMRDLRVLPINDDIPPIPIGWPLSRFVDHEIFNIIVIRSDLETSVFTTDGYDLLPPGGNAAIGKENEIDRLSDTLAVPYIEARTLVLEAFEHHRFDRPN